MKKIFVLAVLFFSVVLLFSLPVVAKKKDLNLSGGKKFKPKLERILKVGWTRGLKSGGSKKRYYPETSVPTIEDGIVYVGTHGGLFYAVDQTSGKVLWKYKNDEPIASTATVSGDRVFFADLGARVVALNKADGSLVWQQEFDSEILGQPALWAGNLCFLKGEQHVTCLSQSDGRKIWGKTIQTYVKDITMRGQSSLVSDGAAFYLGLADGHLYRLNPADGKILWEKNLSIPLRSFKDVDANVVFDGDSLYVAGYFGALYRLNKASGSIVWSSDVGSGTSALVLNQVVVVSDTNGSLVGIDKGTGKQLWFNELNASVLSVPVKFNDHIYVSTFDGDAYLVNPQNGYEVQKIDISSGSINEPIVENNRIVLLTNDAQLMTLVPR